MSASDTHEREINYEDRQANGTIYLSCAVKGVAVLFCSMVMSDIDLKIEVTVKDVFRCVIDFRILTSIRWGGQQSLICYPSSVCCAVLFISRFTKSLHVIPILSPNTCVSKHHLGYIHVRNHLSEDPGLTWAGCLIYSSTLANEHSICIRIDQFQAECYFGPRQPCRNGSEGYRYNRITND